MEVVYLHAFLTSSLVEVEWSILRTDRFTCEEGAPVSHCVVPRAGLGAIEKEKNLSFLL